MYCVYRYEMLTRGSVKYDVEAEADCANRGTTTGGDTTNGRAATKGACAINVHTDEGFDADESSAPEVEVGSKHIVTKPPGRVPVGCAWDHASGTWVRASVTTIEREERGAKRRRGHAQ